MVYHPWLCGQPEKEKIKQLVQATGLPSLACGVLASRGMDSPQAAQAFLRTDQPLSSPSLLTGAEAAAARIRRAVDAGERIAVFGDYDVDGVCATALMYGYLESLGANVFYKLPNRADEGYGLCASAVKTMADRGITLIITVDNGVSAAAEVAYAKTLGVDVVVTDHHIPPEKLPEAAAVVDPQLPGDASPCKSLAGVGVAFKVVCAVDQSSPDELLDWYGDLVAVGTIADIMSLTGENRVMVRRGLEMLQQNPRPGLQALIETAGLSGRLLTAESVSFGLAPRMNAAGRMDDATAALRLLLSEDEEEAAQLAAALDGYNQERQRTEREIVERIAAELDADPALSRRRVLVVWGEGYHQGVIGIVASRLVERYGRPAIVFSVDGAEAKGSGRSVPGFSLYEAIASCGEMLIRFGGHDAAAGLSIETGRLEEFARAINAFAAERYPVMEIPPLRADLAVALERVTVGQVAALEELAPFGSGNPQPLFLVENALLDAVYPLSEGRHSRLRLRQGNATLYAVLFGVSPSALGYHPGDRVEALVYLSVYDGHSGPMLSARVRELRPAGIGNDYVMQTQLYQALEGGSALTDGQRRELLPNREEVASVFRLARAEGIGAANLCPCFARLAPLSAGKIQVALQALCELELIERRQVDGEERYLVHPVSGKRDPGGAPILRRLGI